MEPAIRGSGGATSARLEPCTSERWRAIAGAWRELATEAEVPFFMSEAWVETWLEVFGPGLAPELFVCAGDGNWLGASLVVVRSERRGPVPVRCAHLHTAGEDAGEGVCVEYDELLCRPGADEVVARALAEALRARGVDELAVGGFTHEALARLRRAVPDWIEETTLSADAFVDLEAVRKAGGDYRKTALSRNSRAQIGRSLRAYDEQGGLETEVANDPSTALAMLAELIALHQAAWVARGRGGAFASPRNRAFHERLVERAFDAGSIRLLRIRSAGETVGVLYCFVDRARVYFYQSGFTYRDENRFRPGMVAHVCAIEHFLEAGMTEYHFLAGDETTPRYKTSLSNAERKLAWARFQRPGVRTTLVRGLRTLKRRWEARS